LQESVKSLKIFQAWSEVVVDAIGEPAVLAIDGSVFEAQPT
jgi:hypothetical protein